MAECFCKSSGMALCANCRIAELEAEQKKLLETMVRMQNESNEHQKDKMILVKQLADLRGDRDTLAVEVEAWRAPNEECNCVLYYGQVAELRCKYHRNVQDAVGATNASGALTRAGKDHP